MNLAKRCEEGPEGLFGDQGRQSTNEHSRVVRVGGRQLLAIGADEIGENGSRLSVMLPRLLGYIVSLSHELILSLLGQSGRDGSRHGVR